MMQNPVTYLEIPIKDMGRAIEFYEAVFAVALERVQIDGHDLALFPFDEKRQGISGALAKGESYTPSRGGPRVYFSVQSIDQTLTRIRLLGAKIAYPKTLVGNFWIAEFIDSEGNQIAITVLAV